MDSTSKNLGSLSTLYLKYSTIIICFILSLFIGSDGYDKKDKFLVQCARLFTVFADYFLVILGNYRYGIFCFCIVQIMYIIRHSNLAKVNLYYCTLSVILVMVIVIILLTKFNLIDFNMELVVEGSVYGGILLFSLYIALKTKRYLIAVGMFLFFMCDINVAIYNFYKEAIICFLIWLFYLPSQLLLTLSGFNTKYLKQIFKG
jgi:hypothetical protein